VTTRPEDFLRYEPNCSSSKDKELLDLIKSGATWFLAVCPQALEINCLKEKKINIHFYNIAGGCKEHLCSKAALTLV